MRMTKEDLLSALRLAAKGLPAHTAELVKEAATRLDATSVALCESLEQRKALAAENVGLKDVENYLSRSGVGYAAQSIAEGNKADDDESLRAGMQAIIDDIPTPATDRFVAEMKAQGADELAAKLERDANEYEMDSADWRRIMTIRADVVKFSEQLREMDL